MKMLDLTAEVAKRFGRVAKAAHNTHDSCSRDVVCQILTRELDGVLLIETVWTLGWRTPTEPISTERADEIEAQLKRLVVTAGYGSVHRRDVNNYHYVGLATPVPANPTPAFFDEVAKRMEWVCKSVDRSRLQL